jgi:hypothetical protein
MSMCSNSIIYPPIIGKVVEELEELLDTNPSIISKCRIRSKGLQISSPSPISSMLLPLYGGVQ